MGTTTEVAERMTQGVTKRISKCGAELGAIKKKERESVRQYT